MPGLVAIALVALALLLGSPSPGAAAERISERTVGAPMAANDAEWSARKAELRERVAGLRKESHTLSSELKELKRHARSPSARDKPLRAIVSRHGKSLSKTLNIINGKLAALKARTRAHADGKARSAALSSIEAKMIIINGKLAALKRSRSVGAALDVALVIDAEASAAATDAAKL